jgi:hypothetical protein
MKLLQDSRRSRWLLPGLLALLVIQLALNIVDLFAYGGLPSGLVAQTDLAGTANGAAGFVAMIGIAAGLAGWWRAAQSRGSERLRWGFIGAGCVAYALADLLFTRPHGVLPLVLALVAGICFLLLHRQLRGKRTALALLWLAGGIAAANPVVDRYEIMVAGSPGNYRYISANEPYQMTEAAWKRLALARQAQEASEALLLIVVLKLILFDAEGKAPEPVPTGQVQGHRVAER